jgi:hypothetical protein
MGAQAQEGWVVSVMERDREAQKAR